MASNAPRKARTTRGKKPQGIQEPQQPVDTVATSGATPRARLGGNGRVPFIYALPRPSPEPDSAESPPSAGADYQKERKNQILEASDKRTASSWGIGKAPTSRFIFSEDGKRTLSLPRAYRARGKGKIQCDRIAVWPGEDLNSVVWQWYDQPILPADSGAYTDLQNFVEQGVIAKRHEFLGPSPHVAGYSFHGAEEIRIEWWDVFLADKWVEKDTWVVDMSWIRGRWREVPR